MLELALWLKSERLSRRSGAGVPAVADGHGDGDVPHRQESAAPRHARAANVQVPPRPAHRRLHKAFLRYHDPDNWPMLREALKRMGRADLIGNGKHHLVPTYQPLGTGDRPEGARAPRAARGAGAAKRFATQHTGLPKTPRAPAAAPRKPTRKPAR